MNKSSWCFSANGYAAPCQSSKSKSLLSSGILAPYGQGRPRDGPRHRRARAGLPPQVLSERPRRRRQPPLPGGRARPAAGARFNWKMYLALLGWCLRGDFLLFLLRLFPHKPNETDRIGSLLCHCLLDCRSFPSSDLSSCLLRSRTSLASRGSASTLRMISCWRADICSITVSLAMATTASLMDCMV